MRLPNMVNSDGIMKMRQIQFGGIDRRIGAKDGALYDMSNMTTEHFPVLSSRYPRYRYWTPSREIDDPWARGIFGYEKLCWVINDKFFYDGEEIAGMQIRTWKRCSIAAIGNYIVIEPDGYVFDIGTKQFQFMAAGVRDHDMVIKNGTVRGEAATANTIVITGVDTSRLRPGDAVQIDGCTVEPKNNKAAVIREIEGDELRFDDNTFTIPNDADSYTERGDDEVSIAREAPEMDFIVECDNRIWGCKGDTIYCSALGDPFNFKRFDGLETDSWASDTGTHGEFTGAITYQGRPIFFKEDCIIKIYGSTPSGFGFNISSEYGVKEGCEKSLAVVGDVLYYVNSRGVMAYTGGTQQCISENFSDSEFYAASAGTDGNRYYIGTNLIHRGDTSEIRTFVYDTENGIWTAEDGLEMVDAAYYKGTMYMLGENAEIWKADDRRGKREDEEEDVEWYIETADFVEDVTNNWMRIGANKKAPSRLQIRMDMDENGSCKVEIQYDSSGTWEKVGYFSVRGPKKSIVIPVLPHRCDHYRLRLSGTGIVRIYSIAREFYSGGEQRGGAKNGL